jgi:acyl-CoA synthetase (AMP-forming)/AMP-acid ligase II/1-acyl-sn-glycerol-3-phosphate acyltransferase/acyl carrier protein
MLRALRFLLWLVARLILSLRYRVRVRGLEKVGDQEGPFLILPNHPAFVDPPILLTALWPTLHPRPLLYEGNFRNPVLYPFVLLLDALRVPDLEQASAEARRRADQAIADVIDGLKKGQNIILWPSGHLQRDGSEHLGAARAVADILRAVPQAKVLLVRTRGLWGSSFSHAYTGKRPNLGRRLAQGAGLLLANLLFLTPRRKVDVTVEPVDRSRLPEPRREVLNPWLESWYNVDAPEKPTFVPYHFLFGLRTHEYPPPRAAEEVDLSRLKPATRAAVNRLVEDRIGRALAPGEDRPETPLEQLGMDSLDRMDLALTVERRFGFAGDQVPSTLGGLYALAEGLAERAPPKPPPPAWFRPPSDTRVEILADTLAEAFVARALADSKDVVVADDLSGVLTYERLLAGALALSRRFAELPAANVGVLLPSSVGCDLTLLGLYLAGKLPVVLNWTTGPANLAHAARLTGLTHVVTSKPFLDRSGVQVAGAQYLHLEELRQGIGRFELLRTLLRIRLLPGRVRRRVPRPDPDGPAVVLFTSGSEKAPKAVPLTHHNILADLRAAMAALDVSRADSILGFLPAFHSFGLTITGLYPLLSGMRVVRHPDPTDAAGLARKVGLYKPTILVGTPTFVSYVVERARPGELHSLRLVVVGAEKCPPALFERMAHVAPGAALCEGYGITECSPVVSVNPPGANKPGTVGRPLPGVEVCVVDLETGRPLPAGQRGMLLVSGPTVFPGYIGHEGPSPFREMGGKRWYVTGDLVEMDSDGYITFAGRLKRFLKAGGEMVSLPALEEPFVRLYPPKEDRPRVAVEGVETEGGGRRIVLFTTEPITLQEANALLVKEGLHGVMRLDEVRRVEQLPVLGTGKTDYKVLRGMVQGGPEAQAS